MNHKKVPLDILILQLHIFLVLSQIYNSLLLLFLTDYKSGFGGSFGVQNDRQDKSAVGWEHIEKVEKHESQKGRSRDFDTSITYSNVKIDFSCLANL